MSVSLSLFVLMFGFEFEIWVFLELSIFGIGGQIGDLYDFTYTVFILVGDLGFSIDSFGVVVFLFVVSSFRLISDSLWQISARCIF